MRVLVISPHPDDEALGCGGTLRAHVLDGDAIKVVFLTSGERGGHGRNAPETSTLREREARAAAAIIGYDQMAFWRLPDGKARADAAAVIRLANEIASWMPDRIYVTHPKEMHPDHRAAARLVTKSLTASHNPVDVYHFEVWTPLTTMDLIVDISEHIDCKRAAIRAHASQCAMMGFEEAVIGLNRYRGELFSWPGGPHAEVFARVRP